MKIQHNTWTETEKQYLLDNYAYSSFEELMENLPNRSRQTIIRTASELGVTRLKGDKNDPINLPNNFKNWRYIGETEQEQIANFCKAYGQVLTSSQYQISLIRIRKILKKFGVTTKGSKPASPEAIAAAPKPKNTFTAGNIDSMIGKKWLCRAHTRTIDSYELVGDDVLIHTTVLPESGSTFKRTVKLYAKGLNTQLKEEFKKI